MAFTKRIIKDRVTIGGRRYTLTALGDGRYEIVPQPDSVVEVGTALDAELIQRYEDSISDLFSDKVDVVTGKSLVLDTEITKLIALDSQEDFNTKFSNKEDTINKKTAFQTTPTNAAYPSEKLVKDSLDNKVDKVLNKKLSTNDYTNAAVLEVAKVADKQDKSPLDNKRYMLYNGGIEEFNPPSGTYSELLIATLQDSNTISLSTLQTYDLIRIELNVKELTGANASTVDLITHTFKPADFIRKSYVGSKAWAVSTEQAWLAAGGTGVFDGTYYGYANLLSYLAANYPASGQNVGDMARGNDGTLPFTYQYARVIQNMTYRDVKFTILDGNFTTVSATTARFNAPSLSNGVYQLKIYGINY